MNKKELIQKIIFDAIDDFNNTQDEEFQLLKDINEILFSRPGYTKSGKLDSMALVYFIVTVEEHLQLHFGKSFNLQTNFLFDNKEILLNSIQNLISHVEKII